MASRPGFFPGRKDANEPEIVAAFRSVPGWWCEPIPNAYARGTKKLGDLLVRRSTWDAGFVVQIEVKTAKGYLRPEQRMAVEQGRMIVIRSVDDALVFMASHDERLPCQET